MVKIFYQPPPPPSFASGAGEGLSAVLLLSDGVPDAATSPLAGVVPPTALALPHAAQKTVIARQIDFIENLRAPDTSAFLVLGNGQKTRPMALTLLQAIATRFLAEFCRRHAREGLREPAPPREAEGLADQRARALER